MPALVTGRGPVALTDIEGFRPYFRDEDVWALGEREHNPASTDIHETGIHIVDLARIRALGGPSRALQGAIDDFVERRVDGFWIHLDVDVLDSTLMPAVDSPQPDGLTLNELSEGLRVALASPLALGMAVTIFDPDLDADGSLANG